ncbi:galactosylceramide sulfotransferase-like isoform X2 [Apostichopus japonicus]|uniref:galactosylceramide sulfotransferase-like isoform X2 n=1 Tax=Stichopus japonicus TaxID=307972 RepID=UPI003AB5B391
MSNECTYRLLVNWKTIRFIYADNNISLASKMAGDLRQLLTTLIMGAIASMLLVCVFLTKTNPTYMRRSLKYYRIPKTYEENVRMDGNKMYVRSGGNRSSSKDKSLPKEEQRSNNTASLYTNTTKLVQFNATLLNIDQNHTSPLHQSTESFAMCSPKKNIVLLKTHKTGSSTIQNILYRFGDFHDLTFALPVGKSNYFCGNNDFNIKCVASLPKGYQYNVLANHARWVKTEFSAAMPPDTTYITILRHPSTQYESLYNYYKWKNVFHVTFQDFVKNPKMYYLKKNRQTSSAPRHSFRNPSLYDLGLTTPIEGLKEDEIYEKVKSLDEEFHLVLIMEYIEESIILLKDLMCWSWDDVLYFQTNSRATNEVQGMTQEVIQRLIEWNEGDWILYRHFNETLWTKVEHYGKERMKEDIATLRRKINEKTTKCIAGTKHVTELKQITIKRFQLTPAGSKSSECQRMVRPALKYLSTLNAKMSGKSKRSISLN